MHTSIEISVAGDYRQIAVDKWVFGDMVLRKESTQWTLGGDGSPSFKYSGSPEDSVPLYSPWLHLGTNTEADIKICPAVWFDDLDDCKTGGSWKSSIATYDTYDVGVTARSQYAVPAMQLGKALQPYHTVVKADIEGSEMSVLLDTVNWGACRLLFFEYSVARCRRYGLGWRPFAALLKKLQDGGWTHVYLPPAMYKPNWWIAGTASQTESMDTLCFCYRASAESNSQDTLAQIPARLAQELAINWKRFAEILVSREKPQACLYTYIYMYIYIYIYVYTYLFVSLYICIYIYIYSYVYIYIYIYTHFLFFSYILDI